MIVSGLLASVGINFALCIIFFTLYSVLRKQPGNYKVYAPRLLAAGKAHRPSCFHLNRLVPTLGWIKSAWKPSEDELLSYSGLDAVVFMRIIIFRFFLHFQIHFSYENFDFCIIARWMIFWFYMQFKNIQYRGVYWNFYSNSCELLGKSATWYGLCKHSE